jgi:hypothetical protein
MVNKRYITLVVKPAKNNGIALKVNVTPQFPPTLEPSRHAYTELIANSNSIKLNAINRLCLIFTNLDICSLLITPY